MTDTMMTIIGIFVAVILMLVFPLVEVAGKNDDISQTAIQIAMADFVNSVAIKGKITEDDYNKLVTKVYATRNSYEVIIEAKILDENPEKRTITSGGALQVTESQYYSVYTNTILDKINNSSSKEYLLKKDDYIVVTVKNTNKTLGTQLKGIFYKFIGKDTYTLGGSDSALVINTGVTGVGGLINNVPITPPEPPEPPETPPPAEVIPPIELKHVARWCIGDYGTGSRTVCNSTSFSECTYHQTRWEFMDCEGCGENHTQDWYCKVCTKCHNHYFYWICRKCGHVTDYTPVCKYIFEEGTP